MNKRARSIVILGATGSIGRNTLAVAEASEGRIRVAGLSAHSSLRQLCDYAQQFGAKWVVATDPESSAYHSVFACGLILLLITAVLNLAARWLYSLSREKGAYAKNL